MRKSISQEIFEALRKRILDGELLPGDRILERELREEFNASNSPVREAVRMLFASGFAEAEFNKGAIVAHYNDPHRRKEAYEARAAIELYCASKIAAEQNPAKVRELRKVAAEMERKTTSIDDADISRIIDYDELFHRKIVELAGNGELFKIYTHSFLFLKSSVKKHDAVALWLPETLREHREIVEAIEANDDAVLRKVMKHHFEPD
jgi:DNA-binding GntR family transcriptional regulator